MKNHIDNFDQMLAITADLFYSLEHELFFSSMHLEGKRILDVGCGNGAYLSKVHGSFPTAELVGVEYDEGIFQKAIGKANEKMQFHRMSYEELPVTQPFDLVILRLVIHHLPDKKHFSNWLRSVTHAESTILVIEIDNEKLNDNEQLPLFSALYKQSRQGIIKNRFLDVKDALRIEMEHYGWLHEQTTTYSISADQTEIKQKLYAYMKLVAQSNVSGPIPLDLLDELETWLYHPTATHQVHMFGMTFYCRIR
ncbi:class I SAM-dependent methyltransferase [Paenibacillus sp. GCM10027628]|uniref:class I SAM-dependent methyltransferase n=1 Tax=Paenibacillus sp. GCM10027628 TaxID=3273413 RepID=UPI00362CBECF